MIENLAALVLVAAMDAQFNPSCGPREEIVAFLRQKHNEELVDQGVTSQGNVMEFFTSSAGTWSILMSNPSGRTCFMLVGEKHRKLSPKAKGENL